jgi:hypothetical protein
LAGRVDVTIKNGVEDAFESLSADGSALLIPPMLWSTFIFEGPSTVLAVFCDVSGIGTTTCVSGMLAMDDFSRDSLTPVADKHCRWYYG